MGVFSLWLAPIYARVKAMSFPRLGSVIHWMSRERHFGQTLLGGHRTVEHLLHLVVSIFDFDREVRNLAVLLSSGFPQG